MMKSLMLKSLILILSSSFLFAQNSDEKLIEFLQKTPNSTIQIKSITVIDKKELKEAPNWYAYFLMYEFLLKDTNETMKEPSIVYSNGIFVTNEMLNINTKARVDSSISPKFDPKFYDKEHLLYGNENAENKIVIFSDPQCPYCLDMLPFVFDLAKKNPTKIALYYYHFPLSFHPAAKTIVKAVLVAEKKGVKEALYKTYKAYIDIKSSDENEILKIFNKSLNTNITKEEINQKDIIQKVEYDINIAKMLFIRGTPSLFVNGDLDFDKSKYIKIEKELIKK